MNSHISPEQEVKSDKTFDVHKMLFIFNALNQGWTVRMTSVNNYVFTKNRDERELNLDELPKNFLLNNLNINK